MLIKQISNKELKFQMKKISIFKYKQVFPTMLNVLKRRGMESGGVLNLSLNEDNLLYYN